MSAKASELVWYLAYGSNMSSAKFTGSRGIVPLETARVRIPTWVLTMEIPGLPYSEPSFSSIAPRACFQNTIEKNATPPVVGVAYLITQDQYRLVLASEGGGTAYRDVLICGEPLEAEDARKVGQSVWVRTLGTAMSRRPWPSPSRRYKVSENSKYLLQRNPLINFQNQSLLTDGAQEGRLPTEYQQYLSDLPVYEPPDTLWARFGAFVFTSVWGPVMALLERITRKNIQNDGNAHWCVVLLVRWTMFVIWVSHDRLFAPVFGRGDGL